MIRTLSDSRCVGDRGRSSDLDNGIAFLRRQIDASWLRNVWPAATRPIRSRVVANWLNELNCLLDICLLDIGQGAPPHPRPNSAQAAALQLRRITACGGDDRDLRQLRALHATHHIFRHHASRVTFGDRRDAATLTLGWYDGNEHLTRVPLRSHILFNSDALLDVCALYARLNALLE